LIATLAYGLTALALLFFLSASMAGRFFHESAERSVRRAFLEENPERLGSIYTVSCRDPDLQPDAPADCDPIAIAGDRILRSAKCGQEGLLGPLRNRWACVARFRDASTLSVEVSIGIRRDHLELILPLQEPE
jgi:hypothetical protein